MHKIINLKLDAPEYFGIVKNKVWLHHQHLYPEEEVSKLQNRKIKKGNNEKSTTLCSALNTSQYKAHSYYGY